MISSEGERCKLRHCNFRGEEIEEWLRNLEDDMHKTLNNLCRLALIDYEKEETSVI